VLSYKLLGAKWAGYPAAFILYIFTELVTWHQDLARRLNEYAHYLHWFILQWSLQSQTKPLGMFV